MVLYIRYMFLMFLIYTTSFSNNAKKIALTFDDGPRIKITEEILEVLRENEVKGTFFILGLNGKRLPDVLQKIHDDGHQLANHSYNHPNLRKMTVKDIEKELKETNSIISNITGKEVKYFRPPYGALGKSQKQDLKNNLGMHSVMWNVSPQDWEKTSDAEYIENFLIENAKKNGIVLLHDYSKTAQALRGAIPKLKEEGYEFVTIENIYKK
ncbi:MAG: polysaccharide deacetylase family protein [Cetobacterium sp.]